MEVYGWKLLGYDAAFVLHYNWLKLDCWLRPPINNYIIFD